jgi:Family of unknown function (DUF5678)
MKAPLSQELDDYDGRWVAVRDGAVVAHASDEEALRRDPACRHGDLYYPIGDPVTGFYMINV